MLSPAVRFALLIRPSVSGQGFIYRLRLPVSPFDFAQGRLLLLFGRGSLPGPSSQRVTTLQHSQSLDCTGCLLRSCLTITTTGLCYSRQGNLFPHRYFRTVLASLPAHGS
jgi:hypothetical protein